jgi:hypothetical protein
MLVGLGSAIIISGFFAPLLSEGKIPSNLIFWVGFLILCSPRKQYPRQAFIMKWASIGIVLKALGEFVFIQLLVIVVSINHVTIFSKIIHVASYIIYPISHFIGFLFSHPNFKVSDGSVSQLRYLRVSIVDFLNVLAYVGIGVLIGKSFIKGRSNTPIKAEEEVSSRMIQ